MALASVFPRGPSAATSSPRSAANSTSRLLPWRATSSSSCSVPPPAGSGPDRPPGPCRVAGLKRLRGSDRPARGRAWQQPGVVRSS